MNVRQYSTQIGNSRQSGALTKPAAWVQLPAVQDVLVLPHAHNGHTHRSLDLQRCNASSSFTGTRRMNASPAGPALSAPFLPLVDHAATAHDGVVCFGYVGQGARPAAQYHECDFDWLEHSNTVRHIVDAQQAQALALHAGAPTGQWQQQQQEQQAPPTSTAGGTVRKQERDRSNRSTGTMTIGIRSSRSSSGSHHSGHAPLREPHTGTPVSSPQSPTRTYPSPSAGCNSVTPAARTEGTSPARASPLSRTTGATEFAPQHPGADVAVPATASAAASTSALAPTNAAAAGPARSLASAAYEGSKWEEFYRSHPSARFFKERRYLLLEFPELLAAGHVAEIGCGCGSSILPVLKANSGCRTTCSDISTTCLDQLVAAAEAEGIARERLSVFPADATDPSAAPAFDGISSDALLIMFTLSAVPPEEQHIMLSHAWRALRPGGRLMIRDHGLYDMVQLRIPADQWVGPNLYKRGDGTMAFFFSTDDLSQRAQKAGFQTAECKYVTVINRNRKTGLELRRVFVHGVFVKGAGSAAAATACQAEP